MLSCHWPPNAQHNWWNNVAHLVAQATSVTGYGIRLMRWLYALYNNSSPHFEQNFAGDNKFWFMLVLPHESQNLAERIFRKEINTTIGTIINKGSPSNPIA